MKRILTAGLFSAGLLLSAENILRNAGFDFPWDYNGSQMLNSDYDVGCRIYASQAAKLWRTTPFEGWWLFTPDKKVGKAEDGGGFIKLSGEGEFVSDPQPFKEPVGVLSCEVRTNGVKGVVKFVSLNEPPNHFNRSVAGAKEVPLPENTNGKTVRITVPFEGMKGVMAECRIVYKGELEVDNVQIEAGPQAKPFDLRPSDWLELSFDGFDTTELPRFYAGTNEVRKLAVRNKTNHNIKGELRIYLDDWQNPGKTKIDSKKVNIPAGKAVGFDIPVGKLTPDGHVLIAEFVNDSNKLIIPKGGVFNPKFTASGVIGRNMITARNAMRIAAFRNMPPENIWGVGNGFIGEGSWWGGYSLDSYRDYGRIFVGIGGSRDAIFQCAVGGAETFYGPFFIDSAVGDPALDNPAAKNSIDIFNPKAKEILKKRALDEGRFYAKGPGVGGIKMRNESPYYAGGATCPTPAADAAFREWCKKRYKTLDAVNKAWHKDYKSWEEIEQIVSAKMASEQTTVKKEGAAATDWLANIGNLTPDVKKMMLADPGRAMEWCRWRTAASVELYTNFRNDVRSTGCKTLVGNNYCWPNFWPQATMPVYRNTDAPMLDVQYAAGISKDLGQSDEMIDILEMAESTVPGKPIWGIEVYIQPSFPAEIAPLQNWGMVAHGMTNNLVFGWKPYSDHGASAYEGRLKSWEEKDSKPMWMLFDTDGSKLPLFDTNKRSAEEIAGFHKKYNGLSLKRINGRTGYYIPNDTQEYVVMSTANKPFGGYTATRVSIAAQLRFAGATLSYLDDEMLLAGVKDMDTIIVPPSPVMSDEAISALTKFAKNGGNLVLMGPCGVFDPCLNPRTEFGNGEWAKKWSIPKEWTDMGAYGKDMADLDKEMHEAKRFPPIPGGKVIKFKEKGVGYTAALGKGRIFAMRIWPGRYGGKRQATEPFRSYLEDLIKCVRIPTPALWKSKDTPEAKGFSSPIGTGAPHVELVIREKSAKEKFLFVLNQGGPGSGNVLLSEDWNVEDALTGKKVTSGKLIQLKVDPISYRVFRLTKK